MSLAFLIYTTVVFAQNVVTQTASVIHNSVYTSLSSECVSVITICEPTVSSCAASLCQICTGLGITPSIEPCCAAPTPTACFSDYLAGKPLTYPSSLLSSPVVTLGPSAEACSSVLSVSSNCAAATPDFEQLEFSSQASCLCSVNGNYEPSMYDEYFSTCAAWVSTADPSEYSVVFENNGMPVVRTPCQYFATKPDAFPGTTNTVSSQTTPTSATSASALSSGPSSTSSISVASSSPKINGFDFLLTTILVLIVINAGL